MTTVYRVQDDVGCGPFYPGFTGFKKPPQVGDPWARGFFAIEKDKREFGEGYFYAWACPNLTAVSKYFVRMLGFSIPFPTGYRLFAIEVERILIQNDLECLFARKTSVTKGIIEIPRPPDDEEAVAVAILEYAKGCRESWLSLDPREWPRGMVVR